MTDPSSDPRHLLVSDVDDTLLGDDEALGEFGRWLREDAPWLDVAYASGRSVRSIEGSVRDEGLPPPVAIIGGVGAEVVRCPGGDRLEGWPPVSEQAWDPGRVDEILLGTPRVRAQPPRENSTYKRSFYLQDASDEEIRSLERRLDEAGLRAKIIYSSRRDLDVVPDGVDKGAAARQLVEVLGYPADRVYVSGNSANDLALLRTPFRAIVVANADDELKDAVDGDAYVASASHARGVIEGVEAWRRGIRSEP